MLPVVDNFERGLATVPEDRKEDPFVDGMNRIYKQLTTQLFVVPKSMPIILLIFYILLNCSAFILKFFLDT